MEKNMFVKQSFVGCHLRHLRQERVETVAAPGVCLGIPWNTQDLSAKNKYI